MDKETYLGDGLYASFDGYQIRLYAERDEGVHEVYLGPSTMQSLMDFYHSATRSQPLETKADPL